MEQIIKIQFPVMSTPVTMEVTKLDYEESNALRYCAGYILRSVRKKIDKSAHDHPMKKALQLCVQDLYESIICKHCLSL